jgi:ankyrin repeat protein
VKEPLDSNSGLTLLHYAAFYGSVKPMRYILGAISAKSTGKTAGEILDDCSTYLLRKDTIEDEDNCENTPLHSAIYGGEIPALQILLTFEKYLDASVYQEIKDSQVLQAKVDSIKT